MSYPESRARDSRLLVGLEARNTKSGTRDQRLGTLTILGTRDSGPDSEDHGGGTLDPGPSL